MFRNRGKAIRALCDGGIVSEIVAYIGVLKDEIKAKRQQAETLRKEALEEFEKEIFG